MNELKRKILQSDFYKDIYNNQNSRSIELEVENLEDGMHQAAAIFQCPVYELSYKIIRDRSTGIFKKLHFTPYLIRYTHIKYDKSSITYGHTVDYSTVSHMDKDDSVVIDKDTSIVVRVKRDGVFLKVSPPTADGTRIEDMKALEKKLIEAGLKHYDSNLAKEILHEQKGEYVKIADWDPSKSVYNAKITYTITEDNMQAYITVSKPNNGGREIDLQDAKELLENSGIVFGVKEDNISKLLEEGTFNVPILAAEGLYPKIGQNAKIEYLVKVNKDVIPKYIDKIEAKDGKDLDLKDILGDNVVIDGDYIVAGINGQVLLKGKLLSVEPVFEVSGDVGPETGNINFIGSVLVKGSVSDNFSIKAEGNIEVNGTVGKCDLEAKGDIIVKLGIQGNENSFVRAGGDVIAKFIQFSNVESANNVIVTEAILNT